MSRALDNLSRVTYYIPMTTTNRINTLRTQVQKIQDKVAGLTKIQGWRDLPDLPFKVASLKGDISRKETEMHRLLQTL